MPHPVNDCSVRLTPSGELDKEELKALLRRERDGRGAFSGDPDDLAAVASEMLAKDRAWLWLRRWPRWPRWLDTLLHGSGPPGV
jgi:hypothetical protein